jgi:hypothetical protein
MMFLLAVAYPFFAKISFSEASTVGFNNTTLSSNTRVTLTGLSDDAFD